MAFQSVLTVCIGNICRSPLAEAALRRARPALRLASAGLHAPEGAAADEVMQTVAAEYGLDLSAHRARVFRPGEAAEFDLILVMEQGHRREILSRAPHLGGRVMLMTEWNGRGAVADPYRRPVEVHRASAADILAATTAWAEKLAG